MVTGEKAQLSELGRPEQESVIALLNAPDCGVAVTVSVADWPEASVSAAGEASKVTGLAPPPHAGA
ncbi:MAG: hypothetical protein WBX02_22290 [Terriglobales bacterium]